MGQIDLEEIEKELKICKKCRLAETRINTLCGEGNVNADLMLIAQAPGEKEDIEGRMFIGPSGKILDELLYKAGISRKEIYMTNLIKCRLPKNRRPKQDEIQICSEYLDKEIELIKPRILIPLGYYACRYIFQKYSVPMPCRKEFSSVCGQLFYTGDLKIFPLAHPAAILYRSELREAIERDYAKMKILKNECKWYPVCPMKRYLEAGRLDRKWVELYCQGDWGSCVRYQMEVRGDSHPDWMLPDGTIELKLRG